jgi:hypothetical protein
VTRLPSLQQASLVAGIPTPLKKYESVGIMNFSIYGNIKFMFQTTNQQVFLDANISVNMSTSTSDSFRHFDIAGFIGLGLVRCRENMFDI